MAFLEMARDEVHGGGDWSFTRCLFSPTRTKDNKKWPFWSKILNVKKGDLVLHLRGKTHEAFFVGYSIASGDGYEIDSQPPYPGDWAFSQRYYRVDIDWFTPLQKPLKLDDIFISRRQQLEDYFDGNGHKGEGRKNLFYVRQAGKLQCLNGAYLSDIDSKLARALFDETIGINAAQAKIRDSATSTQLIQIEARIGQQEFSENVKTNYGNRCCFPDCPISDARFLVGSHIARWSDNEALRGNIANGLCLCVFHDKAFEVGLFAVDKFYQIYLNQNYSGWTAFQAIKAYHSRPIRTAQIYPSEDALSEHWNRIKIQFT